MDAFSSESNLNIMKSTANRTIEQKKVAKIIQVLLNQSKLNRKDKEKLKVIVNCFRGDYLSWYNLLIAQKVMLEKDFTDMKKKRQPSRDMQKLGEFTEFILDFCSQCPQNQHNLVKENFSFLSMSRDTQETVA